MAHNPLKLLKLKDRFQTFKQEHPDMSAFGKALKKQVLVEGTRFQIQVTTPEGRVLEKEITLTDNDVEMLKTLIGDAKPKQAEEKAK